MVKLVWVWMGLRHSSTNNLYPTSFQLASAVLPDNVSDFGESVSDPTTRPVSSSNLRPEMSDFFSSLIGIGVRIGTGAGARTGATVVDGVVPLPGNRNSKSRILGFGASQYRPTESKLLQYSVRCLVALLAVQHGLSNKYTYFG